MAFGTPLTTCVLCLHLLRRCQWTILSKDLQGSNPS